MHFFHYDMYFFVIAIAFFLEIPHNKCKEVISEVHGMKNSICRFVPEGSGKEVKTLNFVFETQFRTLRQPFIRPYYVLNIVTDGVAYIFCDVLEYVDLHYRDSDMSLKRLSEVFSYTDKYISSLFKANLGIGFKIYLNSLRIRYAQDLARNRSLSVAEIAEEAGFSDSLYFSKAFKKHTGKTPSQFIKAVASEP